MRLKHKNPSKPVQGLLLLAEMGNKYDEQDKANKLIKEINICNSPDLYLNLSYFLFTSVIIYYK